MAAGRLPAGADAPGTPRRMRWRDRLATWRRDRVAAWRDRLLARPDFRAWAARFPLTRPIARRQARALFDLMAGFVHSQILLACVQLRVLEVLAEAPATPGALAARVDLPADAAARLLVAAAALDLVERRSDGRFGLGPVGAVVLGDAAVRAMIEHHALVYADLRDPVALLRGKGAAVRDEGAPRDPGASRDSAAPLRGGAATGLNRYWPYAGEARPADLGRDAVAPYTALMARSQPLFAAALLDAYPFRRHRCLLDLGGGDGTFLLAAAARAPALSLILFDLPPVAAIAAERFAAAGLGDRARAVGGDFRCDTLPAGADVVTLVRVIHDHDDDAALRILRAARRALPAGGTLVVAEPMADASPAGASIAAYFSFYLLAMGSGRPRSPDELRALLRRAGFAPQALRPTRLPLLVQALVARAAG